MGRAGQDGFKRVKPRRQGKGVFVERLAQQAHQRAGLVFSQVKRHNPEMGNRELGFEFAFPIPGRWKC